ncbi:histidine kinase [Plantactinospora endophytica]|uniref:histidine kinase n=1 Tax=Plantactinospora endophytica TaxID=673535 RepID=A0ABQ4EC38_9ACTN|nr:histidine kinase [Plantactinospora endophytica]
MLRSPLRPQAWRDLATVAVGLPLSLVGFVYVTVFFAIGAALLVTPIGLWVVAVALAGARRLGRVHLPLVGTPTGEPVPVPRLSLPPGPVGPLVWRRAILTDTISWRSAAYLVVKLPFAVLCGAIALLFWIYGLLLVAYPLLRPFNGFDLTAGDGTVRRGLRVGGEVLDTWPTILAVSLVGLFLLLVAPYALRNAIALDGALARAMLGATAEERVRQLQQQRQQMVNDSTAILRGIERDLHDGTQAHLVALAIHLTIIKEALAAGSAEGVTQARTEAGTAQVRAKQAIAELRELVRGFHPPVLDAGLEPALQTLASGCAVPVECTVNLRERAPTSIESIAYFCVAELLTNVTKHSRAYRARVDVSDDAGRLRVTVTDDGVGGATVGGGSGLTGLLRRVGAVDGRLTVDSPVGGPTVATVELPARLADG